MRFERSSGVLLHPSSLPGPYGIGDLGDEARRFVDFLVSARQQLWQILPLGPTGYGNSPYQCFSAFAGNPLLLSPEALVRDGLLRREELDGATGLSPDRVDYGAVIAFKSDLIARAAARFASAAPAELGRAFEEFRAAHAWWLDDFALFMALKETHAGDPWGLWEPELRRRTSRALARARTRLAEPIARQRFAQFLFFRQWGALRAYAHAAGVRIIGDIPIFVAQDSADVWAHPELFELDRDGRPAVVAGVPPDYFSATGQLWGNPLYRWQVAAQDGYAWWIARVRGLLELVDVVRIDHFIGFTRYWEIPAGDETAENGRWVEGPGADFFDALVQAIGPSLPIIAEDLGASTPAVERLRDRFELTGMKVLQFAFGGGASNDFLPHRYTRNFAVYTGTHDNDTTVGWFHSAPDGERAFAQRYLARNGEDIAYDLIRAAMSSIADLAIAPLQDVLGLGSEARMNLPGEPEGNWTWRYRAESLNEWHAARLRDMAELYEREPKPQASEDEAAQAGRAKDEKATEAEKTAARQ